MLTSHLKLAWKVLLRRKFFTAVSLFGIGFALLVLLVATALLDHVFAPHAPETRGDRTLLVFAARMGGAEYSRSGYPGYGLLDRYARDLPGVERMAIASMPTLVESWHEERKLRFWLRRADGEYWKILDFEFIEGGPFGTEDDERANHVAVINRATRERLFGDEPAVGRRMEIEDRTFRIVGVVENVPFLRIVPFSDVWVPIGTAKGGAWREELVGLHLGLLLAQDEAAFPLIRSELTARLDAAQLPDGAKLTAGADTLFEGVARGMFSPDYREAPVGWLHGILATAAALFLLLPTVNLVNLNLSRILERSSEIGVRKAFGATSRALVGQFVLENLVLTLLGGICGLGGAVLVLDLIERTGLIPYADLTINLRVLGWGLLLALVFGLASGVWPAWRMSRMHAVQALSGRMG